ncbi:MAG: hypothetical protein RLZZ244_2964 [Verrucomicrobiota bacterium]|jgi:ADP-ribose pyrophosphatase
MGEERSKTEGQAGMRFHGFVQEGAGWRTHAREVVFANPYLEIQRVSLTSPARPEPFEWTVCHRKGGVAVAAQTREGRFVMVRQERVPFQRQLWEFPAGQIDESQGHDAGAVVATGLRELQEEAGYELGPGGEVRRMEYFLSSPGFTDEHVYLLWVRGVVVSPRGAAHDEGEAIVEVREFSGEELRAMVLSGEICDANTLCCLSKLAALGIWCAGG